MPERYPIDIAPPDLAPYRAGNTGVEYVHVLDSGKPGPRVMVQALTHGNEFCGAIALDDLLKQGIRPAQGTLTLAFANVAAYDRFDFDNPNRSRFVDEDYNRVWADEVLNGPRSIMRRPAAWPVSSSKSAGTPMRLDSVTLLSLFAHTMIGRQGSCIECRSSRKSAASTNLRSSRALRSSTESRGPFSTSSAQTRL